MKKVIYLLSMFAAFTLLSCGQTKNTQESEAETDSIVSTESVDNGIEVEKNFTTHDLSMFGLHGHVATVTTPSNGNDCNTYLTPLKLSFTEDGTISEYCFRPDGESQYLFTFDSNGKSASFHLGDEIKNVDVSRYEDGRLKQFVANLRWEDCPTCGLFEFKWNKNGRVSNVSFVLYESCPEMSVEYNEDGLPAVIEMLLYGTESYAFKYNKYDEHGNWTQCSVKYSRAAEYDGESDIVQTFELTRVIEYYPNPVE